MTLCEWKLKICSPCLGGTFSIRLTKETVSFHKTLLEHVKPVILMDFAYIQWSNLNILNSRVWFKHIEKNMGCNSSITVELWDPTAMWCPLCPIDEALVDLEDVLHIDWFHSSKGPQCLQLLESAEPRTWSDGVHRWNSLLDAKVRDSQRTDTAEIHQVLHVPAKLGLNSLNPGETGEHD